ncbi:hypothetical protein L9F63_010661, partial [Diploptera punctata]
ARSDGCSRRSRNAALVFVCRLRNGDVYFYAKTSTDLKFHVPIKNEQPMILES